VTTGTLKQIWIKRARGGAMEPNPSAELLQGKGLVGCVNQGGKRQVTLLDAERWSELMTEVGGELPPSARRANLLFTGIDLENSAGKTVRIGDVELLIHGETLPCEQMEAAMPGLLAAMGPRWFGGAYAEVVRGGAIQTSDTVQCSAG
jgi:MOSC domain-containing protein YiiM